MTSLRAAVYARYSSDLQNSLSIEDQLRKCREYAQAPYPLSTEIFQISDALRAIGAEVVVGDLTWTAWCFIIQEQIREDYATGLRGAKRELLQQNSRVSARNSRRSAERSTAIPHRASLTESQNSRSCIHIE